MAIAPVTPTPVSQNADGLIGSTPVGLETIEKADGERAKLLRLSPQGSGRIQATLKKSLLTIPLPEAAQQDIVNKAMEALSRDPSLLNLTIPQAQTALLKDGVPAGAIPALFDKLSSQYPNISTTNATGTDPTLGTMLNSVPESQAGLTIGQFYNSLKSPLQKALFLGISAGVLAKAGKFDNVLDTIRNMGLSAHIVRGTSDDGLTVGAGASNAGGNGVVNVGGQVTADLGRGTKLQFTGSVGAGAVMAFSLGASLAFAGDKKLTVNVTKDSNTKANYSVGVDLGKVSGLDVKGYGFVNNSPASDSGGGFTVGKTFR